MSTEESIQRDADSEYGRKHFKNIGLAHVDRLFGMTAATLLAGKRRLVIIVVFSALGMIATRAHDQGGARVFLEAR
jgi:hypothetical protein